MREGQEHPLASSAGRGRIGCSGQVGQQRTQQRLPRIRGSDESIGTYLTSYSLISPSTVRNTTFAHEQGFTSSPAHRRWAVLHNVCVRNLEKQPRTTNAPSAAVAVHRHHADEPYCCPWPIAVRRHSIRYQRATSEGMSGTTTLHRRSRPSVPSSTRSTPTAKRRAPGTRGQ